MADINKDIKDVLCGFMDAGDAREAAEDIRIGDQLLRDYPAPQPAAGLIADINSRVAAALKARHRSATRRVGRAVAAIAAVLVVGGMLFFFGGDASEHGAYQMAGFPPDLPQWPHWWDDSAVETLAAEVDDVAETLISVSIDDTFIEDQVGDFDEAELEELEQIAKNDDFWKG